MHAADSPADEPPAASPLEGHSIERRKHGRCESDQQLRKMSHAVEQNPTGIMITSLDGRIEYVNASFSAITGYPREEVIGGALDMLQGDPEARKAFEQVFLRLAAGLTWDGEFANRRKDGTPYIMRLLASPMRQADGSITNYLFNQKDVTEFKRNSTELRKYQQHLEEMVAQRTAQLEESNRVLAESARFVRLVTDSLPASIAYWGSDMRCRFANRSYAARFGMLPEQLVGQPMPSLAEDARYADLAPLVEAVLRGEPQDYTRTLSDEAGARSHHQVTMMPDEVDGTIKGFFVFSADVTAVTQARLDVERTNRELMEAAGRVQAANLAKSAFLANMSHEIRTPINAIVGFSELLRFDCRDDVAARRLDNVSEAARQLLQLVNDILDLSKIESGKLNLEDGDFSLKRQIECATMLVSEQARAKGLAVAVKIAEHLPDAVRGDPLRLTQALTNLLSNAVKFTEHGYIDLTISLAQVTAEGMLLRFEVRDTGIGIPAARIPHLFAPFEQADSSTTRRFGGSGLGLALTRQLARMMGGDAGVQSWVGVGSTFWFTARLAQGMVPEGSMSMGMVPEGSMSMGAEPPPLVNSDAEEELRRLPGRAWVLVVEDNRFNQEVAQAVLERAGLSVDIAADGQQALNMAQLRRYDLVLMDLHMPVMDGFDATRALRKLPDYAATPILALTANAFGEARTACLEAGMNDHIAKPVSPQRLYETLLRWLPAAALGVPAAPSRPAAADWAGRFHGVEGFDPSVGLVLAGGDEAACAGLLRRFIAEHEDGLPGLDNSLATGQRDNARRLAHSLKGAAAAIGAFTLEKSAGTLEAALAHGRPTQDLRLAAMDLEYQLVHIVAALHDGLPAEPAPDQRDEDNHMAPQALDEALEALALLLECGDAGAERYCRDLMPFMRSAFGADSEPFLAAVRAHDDELGLKLIAGLRARTRGRIAEGATT